MDWFHVAEMEPGVHLVAEPGHVCSWLIHGRERSVLLDTGLGVADVAAAIAPVATSPVEVVTSHAHFDHVGGNERFEVRHAHPLGAALIGRCAPDGLLREYAALVAGMPATFARLLELDRAEFALVGPDETVRDWPPPGIGAGGEGWSIATPPPTAALDEGDVLDLGGRSLRVLHTPGHAPDHLCLLDEPAGILFAQDQAYYGPHLVYEEDTDVAAWARSARRLADELRGMIRTVYVAHCLRPAVPPRHLDELAEAGEAIVGGAPLEAGQGLFGEPVRALHRGHFSVLVPPGYAPA
jgi:glyoxylase-like metal-dependent hydrolase (beta-lactamase superfamily II)